MGALALQPRSRSYQPVREQLAEMVRLNEIARLRALTHEESERLGALVLKEQRRSYYRPQRIARLRAELALLETLEMAERGACAEGCAIADPIDAARGADDSWSVVASGLERAA